MPVLLDVVAVGKRKSVIPFEVCTTPWLEMTKRRGIPVYRPDVSRQHCFSLIVLDTCEGSIIRKDGGAHGGLLEVCYREKDYRRPEKYPRHRDRDRGHGGDEGECICLFADKDVEQHYGVHRHEIDEHRPNQEARDRDR